MRGFRPADNDEVFAVNAAAFADHPEQGALDQAGFEERTAQPWFDPEGLVVAERDGEVVGFHWTKAHEASPTRATARSTSSGSSPRCRAADWAGGCSRRASPTCARGG